MATGSIEQLNFEVILDDKSFTDQIKALQKIANDFNTSMSNALTITKRFGKDGTTGAVELGKALESATKSAGGLGAVTDSNTAKQRSHAAAVRQTNAELQSTNNLMKTINMLTGYAFSVVGIKAFLSSLIKVTGEFEVQQMALRNMLQDVAAADRIFQQLYDFSSRSTYRFSELAKYSKQLAAFNIGKDDLLETTKMLGDVASGVGVSMDRIILAYGHVKSSGFLRGIQLRSFSQNGVPILEELSKMFTEIEGKAVSLGDVFDKMMKREIPFEMVEEGFRRMTSEGGKFYQMQEVLAKTLAGQINILKGKWENMMYAVGQSESGTLKNVVKGLQWVVDNLKYIADAIKPVITGFGAYAAVLALVALKTKAVALAGLIREFYAVAKSAGVAAAAVKLFGSAAKAAAVGFGAIIAVVTAVALIVRNANKDMKAFEERLEDIHKTARDTSAYDKEISEIDTLRKVLENANNSYGARQTALERLKSIVPSYHAELTEEGRLIKNNTDALNTYIEALNREAKMKGAKDELAELYKEQRLQQKIVDDAKKAQSDIETNTAYYDRPIIDISKWLGLDSRSKAGNDVAKEEAKLTSIGERIKSINEEITAILDEEAGGANDMIYKISSIVTGIETIDSKVSELQKKARTKGITETERELLKQLQDDREEQTKLYKELMGVDYDKSVRAGESAHERAIKDRIASIKTEIQVLQKYKQTYDSFSSLVGPEMAKNLTGNVYKNANIIDFDFVAQIQRLAESLRALGDAASADSILATLGVGEGKDLQKQLQEAQQTAKAYRNLLEAWSAKDMDASEDTFLGKMGKVVSDLNTKSNELFLKYKKAVQLFRKIDKSDPTQKQTVIKSLMDEGMTEDAANEFWNTFVAKGESALAELYVKNLGNLRTNAQRSVNALADEVLKNTRDKLNMQDWGDKSFSQVRAIMKGIEDLLADESYGVSGEMIQKVKDAGLSLDEFFKLVKEGLEEMGDESKQENLKKVTKLAKFAASQISSLAGELKELGAASGNSALTAIGDTIDGVASAVSSIAQGFAAGGPWGAAIAAVVEVAKQIIQAVTETKELEVAISKAQEKARMLRIDAGLTEGADSIFGSDQLKKAQNSLAVMGKIQNQMGSIQKELLGQKVDKTYTASFMNPLPLETLLTNAEQRVFGFTSNIFARANKDWKAYQDAIKKGYSGIEAYVVKTLDRSGFKNMLGIRDDYKNLKDLIHELGYEMYDDYGNLNAQALQAILDTYPKLGEEDRKWIQAAIDNSEEYTKAIQQIEDVMKDLFGDIASSIADSLVDQWIEAGNAALDYADILDDVAKSYSKMLVKSMIMDEIFNDDNTKALRDAFLGGDYESAMSIVTGLMEQVNDMAPAIEGVLQAFDPYFNKENTEVNASSKALSTNFSQDTIDYWSGQLTLLVEYARRGDEKMEAITGLTMAIRDSMGAGDGNYTANVQTYLATIQSDTSAIRGDIYALKLAVQNMNDKGVVMR